MTKLDEKNFAHLGVEGSHLRHDDILVSKEFRAVYKDLANIVEAHNMPIERSQDGLIKHIIHHTMGTRECCVEAYMQFLKPGERSGKHRHMWEEVAFVLEGSGYDLHWDLEFDCQDEFKWSWKQEPKKFSWERGDFIYIPPFTTHQHYNDGAADARLIVISNRMVKEMGFDWFDQIETAPGY